MRVKASRKLLKSDVAVIGLGNWGTSLAAGLDKAGGMQVGRVDPRKRGSRTPLDAQVLWLCVPDEAIVSTAEWLATERRDMRGQIVVHSSGALDRAALAAAKNTGARTASVHPMMSFPTRRPVPLQGTHFAVEAAETATRRELFALVRRLGGRPFAIGGRGKAMYHAGAMFGSPMLVAALDAGVRCLREAGLTEREALALLGPMAAVTVANVQQRGLARSFSGPLARGDAATVKVHRAVLAGHPLVAHAYDALAALAVADLPSGDRPAIRATLSEDTEGKRARHRRKQ